MSSGKIGRNERCPCGSEKKYKRCCGGTRVLAGPYSSGERQTALHSLDKFTDCDAWDATVDAGMRAFWGAYHDEVRKLPEVLESEPGSLYTHCMLAARDWVWFDHRSLEDGERIIDVFLDQASDLLPGERRYLEQMRDTSFRPYEVEEVVPGESLTLRDTLTGRRVRVREQLGSQTLCRWDLIGARVAEPGASGQAEIDGLVPLGRQDHGPLVESLKEQWDALIDGLPEARVEFLEFLAPVCCRLLINNLRGVPDVEVRMPDGDQAMVCNLKFDIVDEARVIAALDGAGDMQREGDSLAWKWTPRGSKAKRVPVDIRLRGGRLDLETMTRKSALRAQSRLERLLAGNIRPGLAEYQDFARAAASYAGNQHQGATDSEIFDGVDELVADQYEKHYSAWIDEPIPALDNRTPRDAAVSSALRPRLVGLLKDLELDYQRSLQGGQPGYDPYWMWDELGLSEDPAAPRAKSCPPPLGHEALGRRVPGLAAVVEAIVKGLWRVDPSTARVYAPEELATCLPLRRFLEEQAKLFVASGTAVEDAVASAEILGSHLEYLCNYELHHRKTFWVDESLAWMLRQTNLDIVGASLRSPFASFALVFSDRPTLQLAERLLAREEQCSHRGRVLRVMTVYVTEFAGERGSSRGLRLAFTFDDGSADWPYLLSRELQITDGANLDTILESHGAGIDPVRRDAIFVSGGFKRLVQLGLNAILYATSASVHDDDGERLSPASPRPARTSEPFTSEKVYHLPGHIDIIDARRIARLQRTSTGRSFTHRFLVRGHWRRANRRWKNQTPRWIKPHWKGPNVAALVERTYRLKAPPDGEAQP